VGTRKIIHLDLDAFFCSVEEREDESLHGKAFAVGGRAETRGVIASCSYAARAKGIRSAMPTAKALKLCPELIVLSGRHHHYGEASDQVMDIMGRYSGMIEQISIDEAFMDVSDLPQSGLEIARGLQATVWQETHLPCSIGVASNKLVAKIATDYGKGQHRGNTPPMAITVVPPGEEATFLAPLPVQSLWGVGPKTTTALAQLGIRTIGDLAHENEAGMSSRFGKWGPELVLRARGIDDSPVSNEGEIKSISQETTFDKDVGDLEQLRMTLRDLSQTVGYRLRQDGFCATTIRLKLRWPDFTTITRQVTVLQPTDQDGIISASVIELLEKEWQPGKRVRLLGVGASNLKPRAHQLTLWDTQNEKERRLLDAVDAIHDRYGKNALQHGMKTNTRRK
jgi:DNA polymerase-4